MLVDSKHVTRIRILSVQQIIVLLLGCALLPPSSRIFAEEPHAEEDTLRPPSSKATVSPSMASPAGSSSDESSGEVSPTGDTSPKIAPADESFSPKKSEEKPATPAQRQAEEIVVTASRSARNMEDISTAMSVIHLANEVTGSDALAPDLIEGEVGVQVQQTSPGQGSPIIRGMIGSSVVVLVDGMRLNTAFFRPAPNQYIALVDPELVDRIEVLRGTASTLYGSDALGGVVQLISVDPKFEGPTWHSRIGSRMSFSTADSGLQSHLRAGAGKENRGIELGLSYQSHGEIRLGGGEMAYASGYTLQGASSKLLIAEGNNELMAQFQVFEAPHTPRVDELVPGFGQTTPSSAVFVFAPNRRNFLHGRYQLTPSGSWIHDLRLNVAWQRIIDNRVTRDWRDAIESHEQNSSDLLGFTIDFESHLRPTTTLNYGSDLYYDIIHSAREDIDYSDARESNSDASSRFPDGSTLTSAALFVLCNQWLGTKTVLNGGARLSYFDVSIGEADRGVGASLTLPDVSGNLGANFKIASGIHLVANLARGVRVPNVYDFANLGERSGNRFQIPNPDLKPEKVWSGDVGIRFLVPRVTAEAIGFSSRYLDRIDAVETGEITDDGRTVVMSDNIAETELRGLEFSFDAHLTSRWQVLGNSTWTLATQQNTDGTESPADKIPPLHGALKVRYQTPTNWRLESEFRFAGAQDQLGPGDLKDPRINPEGSPAWWVINLRSERRLTDTFRLTLSIENLLDRRYREHASGIDATGRNVIITLAGTFG